MINNNFSKIPENIIKNLFNKDSSKDASQKLDIFISSNIPIMGFIDMQDVSEDNICDTNFEIRNMILKPNNLEEHSIYVELEVEVSCMAYEGKEIKILEDMYSPVEDLKCSKKQINVVSNKQNRTENCTINEIFRHHHPGVENYTHQKASI